MKFNAIFFVCVFVPMVYGENKEFVVITASYNNKDWYQKNLDSVLNQTYNNWRMIYINDNSSDSTGELVQKYINDHGLNSKIQLINNTERKGHLYNQYHAIHSCRKNEIIINLDGDDWLAHNQVFIYLNKVYQNQNVWLTYGQFLYFQKNIKGFCIDIPLDVIKNNAIRRFCRWNYSHLRSFYAGLFQLIKLDDLLYEGNFFPMAADVATMYPMLEMCGERFKFIQDILYIYNDTNPLSFHHHNGDLQKEIRNMICKKTPYNRIMNLF